MGQIGGSSFIPRSRDSKPPSLGRITLIASGREDIVSAKMDRDVQCLIHEASCRDSCAVSFNRNYERVMRRRVDAGTLVSPLPRLYADAQRWSELNPAERRIWIMHGMRDFHDDWVYSGTSAAVAHGLSVSYRHIGPLEIADAHGGRRRYHGRVLTRYVKDDEPEIASYVYATSLPRTVFDCARDLPLRDALAVADSALATGRITRQQLIDYVDASPEECIGIDRARLVARLADGRAGSGGESIARAAMYELGFALPDLQAEVCDPISRRSYFVDFKWELPGGGIVYGELDGAEKYANPLMNGNRGALSKLREERRRESRISVEGNPIVRFSVEDVNDTQLFDRLLSTFGVPRVREPIIPLGDAPERVEVPLEAYGLG